MGVQVSGSNVSVTIANADSLNWTSNLVFSDDNTYDIGANGATRPRTVYVGTSVVTPYLGITKASAVNDSTADALLINYGADGTLGPLYLAFRARPSATGANRYSAIQVGDNSAYRLLALQPSGGNVTIGTTNDIGAKVHVATAAAAAIAQRWTDSTNYTADFGYKASGQAYFGGNTGTSLYLRADNTDYAAITAVYGLDVLKSGSSGTLRVYDQTATTGKTLLEIRDGAGQSTDPLLNLIRGGVRSYAITVTSGAAFQILDTNAGFPGTARVSIASNGVLSILNDTFILSTAKTPTSASDTGTAGQIAWDASYIYVATGTNTWKRAALTTW